MSSIIELWRRGGIHILHIYTLVYRVVDCHGTTLNTFEHYSSYHAILSETERFPMGGDTGNADS